MNAAFWDVLHDGRLVAVSGVVPGDLRLSVEVAYLCRHLPTQADYLTATLAGCSRFEYRAHDEPPLADPPAVAALGLYLLSAGPEGDCLTVDCADGGYGGQLALRYAAASLATAEGRPLSQSEVEAAAERYWSLWEQTHARPDPAPDGGAT